MNICFTSKQKNSDSKLKDDTKKKNKGKKITEICRKTACKCTD